MTKNKSLKKKKRVVKVKDDELEDDVVSQIAEFSEEESEEELYLDDDAEEKLDDYLEGAPAVISKRGEVEPMNISEDYPTENHIYCRTKASKTHREIAPEFNNTLIIREKK